MHETTFEHNDYNGNNNHICGVNDTLLYMYSNDCCSALTTCRGMSWCKQADVTRNEQSIECEECVARISVGNLTVSFRSNCWSIDALDRRKTDGRYWSKCTIHGYSDQSSTTTMSCSKQKRFACPILNLLTNCCRPIAAVNLFVGTALTGFHIASRCVSSLPGTFWITSPAQHVIQLQL
jgi:hypothetical protein